ncbi:MAG TPA: acetyl-CoA carboxylase biotin carboxyl carrier protein [Tepidisphaeraceae bacterium]|nr:acetyl-CoA carboxylase biotin carboxyl carrier protein [Tepidisphaeraceae bacterium]
MSEKTTNKKPAASKSSPMDVGLLQKIVALMSANDLNTVDIRDGEQRIILKRGATAIATTGPLVPVAQPMVAAPAPASAPAAAAADPDAGLTPIKSPMVGTFYAAPSPDAKAFVSVGSNVDEETDVCVIEAMKVFNNIKAECRGTIARILVNNGQTVEFGQPLFLVKPA